MSGQSTPKLLTKERVTSKYLRRLNSLAARDLHDVLGYLSSRRGIGVSGVQPRAAVIDGFEVTAQTVPNMTVKLDVGLGLAPASGTSGIVGATATAEDSNYVMMAKRAASLAIAIAAADPAQARYDLIEVAATATPDLVGVDESQFVDIYDEVLGDYVPTSSAKAVMVHGEPDVFVSTGTPSATPSVPAPTAGRIPIAVVRVFAGATSVRQVDIIDARLFLGEIAALGRSTPSSLRTDELTIDFPADAGASRKTVVNVDACVGGIPCGFRTDAAMDWANGSLFRGSFIDPNFTDMATFTGWTYLYVIAMADNGLRYSRPHLGNTELDVAGADWSHAGTLVISKVAPSLVNGSLAPSGVIRTPLLVGNSPCTPGNGKAICIGAIWWQSGTMQHGLHMLGGKAKFGINDGFLPALFVGAVTHVAPGAAATTQDTSDQMDFTIASNPKGPLTFDVWLDYAMVAVTAKSCDISLRMYARSSTDTAPGQLCGVQNTVHPSDMLLNYSRQALFEEVPVSRVSATRGSVGGGFEFRCIAVAGAGNNHTVGLANSTVPKLAGYRWPQGPVVA